MAPPPRVRLAHRDEWPGLSRALARAFHDDPLMCHLVSARSREDRVTRFFASDAHLVRSRGRVYTTVDTAGASIWAEPGHWRMPPSEILRSAPSLLRSFATSIPRALRTLSIVERVHPTTPHWYLAVLGTDPAKQGRGIGSALLAPVLDECDGEGIGAYLESSKESNLAFYGRHGFEVTEEIRIPGGPMLWGMWRDPRS